MFFITYLCKNTKEYYTFYLKYVYTLLGTFLIDK